MTIELTIQETFTSPEPLDEVVRTLSDVVSISRHMTSVHFICETAPSIFEWTLKERSIFGQTFQGIYSTQYLFMPDRIEWHTTKGNMESQGKFLMSSITSGTTILIKQNMKIPVEPPALLKRGVEMIIRREIMRDIVAMIDQIHQKTPLNKPPAA